MKADGGPAFPVREAERFNPENNETHAIEQHWGMSLRDWFAGKALMGWAAGRNRPMEHEACEPASVARSCYAYADAMLRARERGVDVEDDESWFGAQATKGCLHRDADGMSWASCEVDNRIIAAGGSTRATAIRALRAKVEGGAQ